MAKLFDYLVQKVGPNWTGSFWKKLLLATPTLWLQKFGEIFEKALEMQSVDIQFVRTVGAAVVVPKESDHVAKGTVRRAMIMMNAWRTARGEMITAIPPRVMDGLRGTHDEDGRALLSCIGHTA
jgi:hypothetical protein